MGFALRVVGATIRHAAKWRQTDALAADGRRLCWVQNAQTVLACTCFNCDGRQLGPVQDPPSRTGILVACTNDRPKSRADVKGELAQPRPTHWDNAAT